MGMAATGGSAWLGAPTWTVDAPKLRGTLDRLRRALDAPVPIHGGSEILVHDRNAIASSLREILTRLEQTDVDAAHALSGLVREFQPQQQVMRLRELVESLHHAWRQR